MRGKCEIQACRKAPRKEDADEWIWARHESRRGKTLLVKSYAKHGESSTKRRPKSKAESGKDAMKEQKRTSRDKSTNKSVWKMLINCKNALSYQDWT
jgi:hypothetical protein